MKQRQTDLTRETTTMIQVPQDRHRTCNNDTSTSGTTANLPIQSSTDYTKLWLAVFNSAVEQWPADQEKTQSQKETELWT